GMIRYLIVTGVQTYALQIYSEGRATLLIFHPALTVPSREVVYICRSNINNVARPSELRISYTGLAAFSRATPSNSSSPGLTMMKIGRASCRARMERGEGRGS